MLKVTVQRMRRSFDPFPSELSIGVRLIDNAEVKAICGYCIEEITDEYQDLNVKQVLFDDLCVPILLRLSSAELISLFCEPLNSFRLVGGSSKCVLLQLYDVIQTELTTMETADRKVCLVFNQACAYRFIETLFEKCSLQEIKGEVTTAFAGVQSTGKELTQSICKAAYKLLKASITCANTVAIQALYSSAYRCLALTVAKTQIDEKFFETFLFKEAVGEYIWSRFIDCHEEYSFTSRSGPFETIPISGTRFLESRPWNQAQSMGSLHMSQYLSGTLLEGSNAFSRSSSQPDRGTERRGVGVESVEFESSQYDVLMSQAARSAPVEASKESVTSEPSYDIDSLQANSDLVKGLDDQIIYLELNDVNKQAVMPILVRVVQRMSVLFEDKWAESLSSGNMPGWLCQLKDRLQDYNYSVNVRLFIVRLFLNQPVSSIVKPWISMLLPPMLSFIVTVFCESHQRSSLQQTTRPIKGSGFNYFLKDFIFTVVDCWKCPFPATAAGDSATLISYLLKHLYAADSDVLKDNVLSVSSLIKLWVGTLQSNSYIFESFKIDLQPLLGYLSQQAAPTGGAHATNSSKGSEAVKTRLMGLNVLKTLLEAGYPLLERSSNSSSGCEFLRAVIDCIKFPRKEVAETGSLLAGCFLKAISMLPASALCAEYQTFQQSVAATINAMYLVKDGAEAVAFSTRAVSLNFAAFLTRDMLFKSLSSFSRLKARGKYNFLEILLSSSLQLDDVSILHLVNPHILNLFSDLSLFSFGKGIKTVRLPMIQINVMLLLRKHVQSIPLDLLHRILSNEPTVGIGLIVSEKSSRHLREQGYSFLMDLLQYHPTVRLSRFSIDGNTSTIPIDSMNLQKLVILLLLRGLRDPDDVGMELIGSTVDPKSEEDLPHSGYKSIDALPTFVTEEKPSSRLGIRAKILKFLNECYGLSSAMYPRLIELMGDLFDPSDAGLWLNQATHMLLALCKTAPQYNNKIFLRNLGDEMSYRELQLRASTRSGSGSGSGSEFIGSKAPLFSMERIIQTLSQERGIGGGTYGDANKASIGSALKMNSYIASQISTSAAIQSLEVAPLAGLQRIKGTQQFSWTQTQELSQSTTSSRTSQHSVDAGQRKTQLIDRTSTQYIIDTAPQRVKGTPSSAPSHSSLTTSSQSSDRGSMGPPAGLPLYITTQRVPFRVGVLSANNEDLKAAKGSKKVFKGLSQFLTAKKIQEEKAAKRSKIVVYRNYRVGELPDIEITFAAIVQPLLGLCLHDNTAASIAFGTIYDQLVDILLANSTTVKGKGSMNSLTHYEHISTALFQMIERLRSGVTDPVLTKCLLQRCVHHIHVEKAASRTGLDLVKFKIAPELISEVSLQTLNYHTGIELLEESLLAFHTVVAKPLHPKAKRAAVTTSPADGSRSQTEYSIYRHLSRLYGMIGEDSILIGLAAKLSSSFANDARRAIDAEISGDFPEAIQIYSSLRLESNTSSKDVVSAEEKNMWEDRILHCHYELCEWDQLYDCAESYARHSLKENDPEYYRLEREGDSLMSIMSSLSTDSELENRVKERVFPFYFKSLFHAGPKKESEFAGLVEKILSYKRGSDAKGAASLHQLRMWIEANHSIEIAACLAVKQQWARVLLHTQQSYEQFLFKWSNIHPCAYQARKKLLLSLQRIGELQDAAEANLRGDNNQLLQKWTILEPSVKDPVTHLASLCRVRENSLFGNANQDPKPAGIHISNLYVLIAISAVNHGVLHTVKGQLANNYSLRKKGLPFQLLTYLLIIVLTALHAFLRLSSVVQE